MDPGIYHTVQNRQLLDQPGIMKTCFADPQMRGRKKFLKTVILFLFSPSKLKRKKAVFVQAPATETQSWACIKNVKTDSFSMALDHEAPRPYHTIRNGWPISCLEITPCPLR